MVKKQKSFWIYIIIAIVIILGGVLIYNSLKEKENSLVTPSDEKKGDKETLGEIPSSEGETGIISKIKNLFGGNSGGGGSGGGGGGGASGGGTTGSGGTEYITDQTICQNAQNDNLCNGLDIVYGEGYRTLCCSEHSLCC